jgi:hypothetical protein
MPAKRAKSVAAIAHWLLLQFNDCCLDDQRKRPLRVIAKIPNADRDSFAELLQSRCHDEVRNRAKEDFREIFIEGMEAMPAARDMPA